MSVHTAPEYGLPAAPPRRPPPAARTRLRNLNAAAARAAAGGNSADRSPHIREEYSPELFDTLTGGPGCEHRLGVDSPRGVRIRPGCSVADTCRAVSGGVHTPFMDAHGRVTSGRTAIMFQSAAAWVGMVLKARTSLFPLPCCPPRLVRQAQLAHGQQAGWRHRQAGRLLPPVRPAYAGSCLYGRHMARTSVFVPICAPGARSAPPCAWISSPSCPNRP